jgi:hypothetical protein
MRNKRDALVASLFYLSGAGGKLAFRRILIGLEAGAGIFRIGSPLLMGLGQRR